MPKYIIKSNYGCGDEYEEFECDHLHQAEHQAYLMWKEGAESQADHGAELWTAQAAYDYGLSNIDPNEEGE